MTVPVVLLSGRAGAGAAVWLQRDHFGCVGCQTTLSRKSCAAFAAGSALEGIRMRSVGCESLSSVRWDPQRVPVQHLWLWKSLSQVQPRPLGQDSGCHQLLVGQEALPSPAVSMRGCCRIQKLCGCCGPAPSLVLPGTECPCAQPLPEPSDCTGPPGADILVCCSSS